MKDPYNHAIKLLSKKDYSIYKMRKKLRDKEFSSEEIEETIDLLIEQNYLREREYARARIKGFMHKGYSISYIRQKLETEFVETTESEIMNIFIEQGQSEEQLVDYLIDKKIRYKDTIDLSFEEKHKLREKIIRFVLSKGHSYQNAKERLERALHNSSF